MRRALGLLVVTLVLTGVPSHSGAAAPAPPNDLAEALRLFDLWVEARVAYQGIPGAAVAVVRDQEIVFARGYGVADVDAGRPVTPDTIFGICSISKLFTAIAVLMERDAGRLRLDDPVAVYLPFFTLDRQAGTPPVTVRDLLTHAGGLPREADAPYWTEPDFAFPSRQEIIAGLARQRLLYPPERYFQYSNLGMSLLGMVVEATAKVPYERYVNERILLPLGLSSTTPRLPAGDARLATGYGVRLRSGEREKTPTYDAAGLVPAAGFASTARDLATFAAWQFRLLGGDGEEVLRASTLREMQRPHWVDPDWKTTWGLGFAVWREDDVTYVSHSGSCPGFRTTLRLDPRRRLAVIVLLNAMGESPEAIAAQAFKVLGASPRQSGEEPPRSPADGLERFSGLYRSAWGEMGVVPWRGGLAAVPLPTDNPIANLIRLKYIEGTTFRRIRDDDDSLGEEVVFETDTSGGVTRYLWHNNYARKVR